MRRRKGFTLIELLVVITIIVVLAAFLVPALKRIVEFGLDTQCKTNIRQIGMAMRAYSTEHKTFTPWRSAYSSVLEEGIWAWWDNADTTNLETGLLWPYTGKNPKVYVCPLFQELTPKTAIFSYTINWNIGHGDFFHSVAVDVPCAQNRRTVEGGP